MKVVFGICTLVAITTAAFAGTEKVAAAQPGTTWFNLGVNCFVAYDPKGGEPDTINEPVVVKVRWNANIQDYDRLGIWNPKKDRFDVTILESRPRILPC